MKYNADEIFKMLEVILGDNADGIYICEKEINGEADDCPIFSDTDFCWQVEDTIKYDDDYIDIKHGVSRIVFIPNHKDYVIKMSITGTYDYNNIDIANSDDIITYPEYLEIFKLLNSDCDLMFEENEIRDAAGEELRSILLPNIYIGEWHNMSVYIQEKIATTLSNAYFFEVDIPSQHTTWRAIRDKVITLGDSYENCPLTEDFIYDLIESEGIEKTKLICDELFNLEISDLHNNNVGYTTCGKCVIFDYAGFDEDYLYTEKNYY